LIAPFFPKNALTALFIAIKALQTIMPSIAMLFMNKEFQDLSAYKNVNGSINVDKSVSLEIVTNIIEKQLENVGSATNSEKTDNDEIRVQCDFNHRLKNRSMLFNQKHPDNDDQEYKVDIPRIAKPMIINSKQVNLDDVKSRTLERFSAACQKDPLFFQTKLLQSAKFVDLSLSTSEAADYRDSLFYIRQKKQFESDISAYQQQNPHVTALDISNKSWSIFNDQMMNHGNNSEHWKNLEDWKKRLGMEKTNTWQQFLEKYRDCLINGSDIKDGLEKKMYAFWKGTLELQDESSNQDIIEGYLKHLINNFFDSLKDTRLSADLGPFNFEIMMSKAHSILAFYDQEFLKKEDDNSVKNFFDLLIRTSEFCPEAFLGELNDAYLKMPGFSYKENFEKIVCEYRFNLAQRVLALIKTDLLIANPDITERHTNSNAMRDFFDLFNTTGTIMWKRPSFINLIENINSYLIIKQMVQLDSYYSAKAIVHYLLRMGNQEAQNPNSPYNQLLPVLRSWIEEFTDRAVRSKLNENLLIEIPGTWNYELNEKILILFLIDQEIIKPKKPLIQDQQSFIKNPSGHVTIEEKPQPLLVLSKTSKGIKQEKDNKLSCTIC
jgi:hypothetical protein